MISRQSARKFRPAVESLEGREVPAVDFSLAGNTLNLFQFGFISRNDRVHIFDDGKGGIKVEANFRDGSSSKDFAGIGTITKIDVKLKGGADRLEYTLTGSPSTGAQALEVTADLSSGNDTFKADLGNQVLRANRTFSVEGKSDNDTFSVSNVGDVGAAAVTSPSPGTPAVTPTLKFDLKGGTNKDTAEIKANGSIYGTLDVAWDGGGDSTGFLFNRRAIDSFKLEATGVNVKKGATLKVASNDSNAEVRHSGQVNGNATFNINGTTKNDTIKLFIDIAANPGQGAGSGTSGETAGGSVSIAVDARAGRDNVDVIATNAASAAATGAEAVGFSGANVVDGGTGTDTGKVSISTLPGIQVKNIENLTNL